MAQMRSWVAMTAGAAMAALAGCVTLPDRVAFELRAPAEHEQHAFGGGTARAMTRAQPKQERRGFDASTLLLAHGQIIVSETGGAMSLFYSLFAADYAPWVHAGIVAIEEGEAVVYETVGSFFPVPGFVPTDTVTGAVRRVSVDRFARGKRIVGVYALPVHTDPDRLVAFAREHYRRGTLFDPYFDTDDVSALYCTEFVAMALAAAGATSITPTPIRDNESLATARDWLHLRSRSVYLAGRLIESTREMARWSADLSPAQIEAYFAIKRELHRRFDAQARLGHVFRWNGFALSLREDVQRFVDAALAAADEPSLDSRAVLARIDHLAQRHFDSFRASPAKASLPTSDRSPDVTGRHASVTGDPRE